MPDLLYVEAFTVDKRPLLDHFDFGNELWERQITSWIKGDEVEESINKFHTKVWLYRLGQEIT